VLDLTDGQIQEGHAIADLDNGLGSNATHGSAETTVELQHSQLVEEIDGIGVGEVVIVDDLALGGRSNAVPVPVYLSVSFCRRGTILFEVVMLAYTSLPLALSLRYRRKRAKKLSISVSKSCTRC
jgi:hypothetical protein